jgi:hypothetical protein
VSQQSPGSSGYILNPASVTSNPYIPNISGVSHPGIGGLYYPHQHLQNPNNGMTSSSPQQNPGAGVIVYDDKKISHHHHYQQH